MAGSRMNKRLCLLGLTLLSAALYGWFRLLILTFSYDIKPRPASSILRFSNQVPHDVEWYQKECAGSSEEKLGIASLEDYRLRWKVAQHPDCITVYHKFQDIYSVSRRSGQLVIPETFQTKVLKWLGNDEELFKETKLQFITSIFNRYTHESAIFNPLRSKRPGVSGTAEEQDEYVESLVGQSQNCDLCDYKFKTSEDTFGRIESKHAVTAANTFKYDAFHALIILKTHHPLRFTEEQFTDMFDVTMAWFMKVHTTDKQYRYPHLMWDNLPKASASQIHPHAQASMSPVRHYGLMEHIRLSAVDYSLKNGGQNYFSDLIQVHNALGLTTSLGGATAIAYLTPKKDHEVMIVSKVCDQDFVRLLFYTIRAFIDDMQLYAWSLAVFLPKLEPYTTPGAEDIPAIARIISRGPLTSPRSDISSMELFAASNVNVDPFTVIEHIKKSVELKGHLQAADLKKIAERKERLKQEMDELEKQEEELEQKEQQEKEEMEREAGDPEGGGDAAVVGIHGAQGKEEPVVGANPPLPDPLAQNLIDEHLIENGDADAAEKEEGGMEKRAADEAEGVGLAKGDNEDIGGINGELVERRDTMRRVDWPGKVEAGARENGDDT
ncbi:uncharacterized protein [Diadema antillarum]|uniref:uncharacterized protein n=1 Tax=Diadema antillarum TaxID=105358 RepID=UPI003A8791D3